MPQQEVKFSKTDSTKNYMMVDHDIVTLSAGDTITFHNELNPANDAVIKFFRNGRKKAQDDPIYNFCDNSSNTFEVAAGTAAVCTVRKGIKNREYMYTISAEPEYVTLDPVVIIDRPSGAGYLFTVAVTLIVGAGVGAFLQHKLARRNHSA